jgi:hypothetical protein
MVRLPVGTDLHLGANMITRPLAGLLPAIIVGGAAFMATPAAHAQSEQIVVVEAVRASLYANGGIGKEEEAYMRRIAKDFSLHIEFSERKDNEFVADAKVVITDVRGNPVFMLGDAGPITLVNLQPGRYRVAATFRGKTEAQSVEIKPNATSALYFHWQGATKTTPSSGRPAGGKEIQG